jgi:hypothetical protein
MDVPTSVSLHCRMYYLGHLYDLENLKSQAYVNVLRQCEFGCSSPNMPIDLCPAIDFVYRHLQGHDAISDALVQYCVTQCVSHKLHENAEFRKVAFHVRAFHQDLTKACRDRGYEDDSAAIIIQLPYMHYAPSTYASTEDPPISRFEDVVHHYHSTDRFDNVSPKKRQRATFDERQTSPTKALQLQESTEKPVNGLALRRAPEKSASVNYRKQSTLESEAKMPETHDAPRWQLGMSQMSHQQMSSGMQAGIAKAREEERLRKPSATDISSNAQRKMASLTEEEKVQMRNDAMRNMSEHQLQLASERKQDPLWQHIYEKAEQEAMDQWMLTQAAEGQPQNKGLPLRPALETPIPAATSIMTKLSMRSRVPSSANVLGMEIPLKAQDSSIWERRGMAGANPGLSRALNTLQNQEKPQGAQLVEVAAPQKQGEPTLTQPKGKGKQRKVVDAEFNPTFNTLQSVQGSISCEEVIRNSRAPSMQQNSAAEPTQDDPFKVCPQATTPSASVAPSAPLRANYPSVPINAGPNSGNHALQDYQMQLRLLEQQNKKRLLIARQETDSLTSHLQPAFPAVVSKIENETLHERFLRTRPRAERTTESPAATTAGGVVKAAGEPEIVAHASASKEPPVPQPSENQRHALSDWQSQLMLLEEQNKNRLLMARQDEEIFLPRTNAIVHTAADSQPPVPEPGQTQRTGYEVQLMLLEQQNKKRLLMRRQESSERASAGDQPPMSELSENQSTKNQWPDLGDVSFDSDSFLGGPSPVLHPVEPHAALSDWQIQALLLGQQEKKRMVMARLEEDEEAERVKPKTLLPKTARPSADASSSSAAAATKSDRRQGGFTFPCQIEGENDVLANFDFDAFLETDVMESNGCFDNFDFGGEIPRLSSAHDQDRNAPGPQPNEERTLESYQAQLAHLEQENKRRCMLRSAATDPVTQEASRAMSRPALAAAAAAAAQDEGENEEFANLHLDAFFTKEDRNESEREESYRGNDLFESDSEHGAGSDSDAQSWVDVAMEPSMSPSDTATARRTASIPVPASPQRSPSHSDSEWEIC